MLTFVNVSVSPTRCPILKVDCAVWSVAVTGKAGGSGPGGDGEGDGEGDGPWVGGLGEGGLSIVSGGDDVIWKVAEAPFGSDWFVTVNVPPARIEELP
jgi:hypothetical protein